MIDLLLTVLLTGVVAPSLAGAIIPPGTPAPDTRPAPAAPVGATGGKGRWQIGSPTGLYVVDPAAGEIALQGVTSGSVPLIGVGLGRFGIAPADTVVTLNGVPLVRKGNPLAGQWTVDPNGPQPVVGSGGFLDIIASDGSGLQREMVLQCPADIAMSSDPPIGATLAGRSFVQLTFARTLVFNLPGIPALAGVFPMATLSGYDPVTGRIDPSAGGRVSIGTGQLGTTVPITMPASTSQYLMDVRWQGPWQQDGETGAFCGLAKRWIYSNSAEPPAAPHKRRAVGR